MKNTYKVRLRALTIEDLPFTLKWNNQDDINELYSGHPFPVNKEMEIKWYEKVLTSNIPTTAFGIEEIETSELIGITLLKNINLIDRKAELAIYIGDESYRGKGLSKEATILTLDFAFNKLGIHRIWLIVLEQNDIAVKLYKSVGFCKEGLLRGSRYKNGIYKNEIIMSLLRDEYQNRL